MNVGLGYSFDYKEWSLKGLHVMYRDRHCSSVAAASAATQMGTSSSKALPSASQINKVLDAKLAPGAARGALGGGPMPARPAPRK